MTVRCVILGAGGHGRVVLDALRSTDEVEVYGFLDPAATAGTTVNGVEVLGGDELLRDLPIAGVTHFVLGVGSINDNTFRHALFDKAGHSGLHPLSVRHRSATIAETASVQPGAVVLAATTVGPGAVIGSNVIINTGAIIEHDCIIDDHAHIASGAVLAGGVRVGQGAFVGAASVTRQGIRIGGHSTVGCGAVVVHDVGPGVTVVGVPAHVR